MTIDERRQRLRRKLEEVLGPEEAGTLMEDLGTRGVTPVDLRTELERLRTQLENVFDSKLGLLEARVDAKLSALEARLLERMNDQTKTLFRTFMVTNAAMVLAVATLAFGAARVG
jgi:CHASE1-domain containing sensor protein